jgi:hypothetical protein
MVAEEDI